MSLARAVVTGQKVQHYGVATPTSGERGWVGARQLPSLTFFFRACGSQVQHRRLLAGGNGAMPGMPGGGDMAQLPRDGVPPIPPIGRDLDAEPTVNGAAPGESCRDRRSGHKGHRCSQPVSSAVCSTVSVKPWTTSA